MYAIDDHHCINLPTSIENNILNHALTNQLIN